MSYVSVKLLKPHPKNRDYYNDLPSEKYWEVKRSIEINGIRDPLKVLPDYTVLAGHQRLRIALELGLEQVPVEVKDVSPEEAEYLLIADNEERRQNDDDPVKKAKRAKFLAEYWGVKRGGDRKSNHQNGEMKKAKDVAKAVGVDAPHLNRLLKLNDLIPELQSLVSSGKLGTTAAEQLAYLTPEVQRDLYRAMGGTIGDLTLAKTKDLRKKIEQEIRQQYDSEKDKLLAEIAAIQSDLADQEEQVQELQETISTLNDALENSMSPDETEEIANEAKTKIRELTEAKAQYKELEQRSANQIKELEQQLKQIQENPQAIEVEKIIESPKLVNQLEQLKKELVETREELEKYKSDGNKQQQEEAAKLEAQIAYYRKTIERHENAVTFINFARKLISPLEKQEDSFDRLLNYTTIDGAHRIEAKRMLSIIKRYSEKLENALNIYDISNTVIDIPGKILS